ncbi:acetoacetyl-CoA reductase [Hymenobacter busanensis]|uniref:Acetoacetyl-CoA reductase n=1 Tax=Hymenobacter busanensis TaxID=2607656 RepID=A0A7L4ZRZ8_9BACT|nr:acetoacetyl-CoA reductase [Hymenobacter busanensis]KAA9327641.1 acetoacetyl-CoA reductase [Hymenobacter busanensis]QHJ06019.1 acetoacetyl-CoA reductase [Hymenobacter busanensis]
MNQENKRVALITGSTGGIGTALCRKLGELGYRVVGNFRNDEKAAVLQQELDKEGLHIELAKGDVGDFDSVGAMVQTVEQNIGPIDILINNAGITRDTSFVKMSKADWDEVLNTNLNSVFNCTRHVIQGMVERRFGRIINISSINAQKGQYGQTNYSTAKAGMHGFTKSLALEVAKYGITVNTISPGYIETEMVMAVPENIRERIIAQIPVGRLGGPTEIADAVAFLISDQSGFITGSNLAINGGQHMS